MNQKIKARMYAGVSALSFGALIVSMGAPVKWW
jgi:hypothetical protein